MNDLTFHRSSTEKSDWLLPALCVGTHGPTIEAVIARTSLACGLSSDDLRGYSRLRAIAWPRQYAMFVCREMRLGSLSQIGEAFGNRDHTTVMHAMQAVEKRMTPDIRQALDTIKSDVQLGKIGGPYQ